MVGICLGSQLIGEALGAPVMQSPEKEVGPLSLSSLTVPRACSDDEYWPILAPALVVGHWHNDMPGLTPDGGR